MIEDLKSLYRVQTQRTTAIVVLLDDVFVATHIPGSKSLLTETNYKGNELNYVTQLDNRISSRKTCGKNTVCTMFSPIQGHCYFSKQ